MSLPPSFKSHLPESLLQWVLSKFKASGLASPRFELFCCCLLTHTAGGLGEATVLQDLRFYPALISSHMGVWSFHILF